MSHVTWIDYATMLRILKHYKFNYRTSGTSIPKKKIQLKYLEFILNLLKDNTLVPGNEFSFSGYPGMLASIDDFYVLKSKLVVTETTISNSNTSLWKFVTPQTNFYWVRCLVANK